MYRYKPPFESNNFEDGNARVQGHRRTVDHGEDFSKLMAARANSAFLGSMVIRPQPGYIVDLLPPTSYKDNATVSICSKFIHTSVNKIKHSVLSVVWAPEGRRLITGSMSGEFTLWNGFSFNFETIMQAHESCVRAMTYSHNGEWLLSGDQDGAVKYWQSNFNNVNVIPAHREIVRDIAFSPNDSRFATASDDGSVKIWNFADASEESTLNGHGWDVKSVDWHKTLGLLASGSKDNLVKLWDPRSGGKCLATLHGYKNTVTKCRFQPIGAQNLLATCSRDHTARLYDLRMMRDCAILRGHDSDVSTLTWHPIHSNLLTTGCHDGRICFFVLDDSQLSMDSDSSQNSDLQPYHVIPHAHDWPVWALQYHPLGHILCSGGNDKTTRFWCRARPGDETAFNDRYYTGDNQTLANTIDSSRDRLANEDTKRAIPGLDRY